MKSYVELEELTKENEVLSNLLKLTKETIVKEKQDEINKLQQQIDSLYQQLIEKDCKLKGRS